MPEATIESYSTTQVTLKFDSEVLSTATGFVWRYDSEVYLVTNWHNVAGRNALSGKCLSRTLAIPNYLEANIHSLDDPATGAVLKGTEVFRWEVGEQSSWLEHPRSCEIDVMLLPLGEYETLKFIPINYLEPAGYALEVASDVFILGYPLGIGVADTPIWKRGTIASEPNFDIDELPKMLVDTTSSKGMSGSPVIIRQTSGRIGNSFVHDTKPSTRLIGIYSGRVSPSGDLDAQLGVVWKASVLEEIVLEKKRFVPK